MSLVKKTIELFGEPAKITNTPNYDEAFKVIEEQFKNIIKVTDATGEVLKSTKDLCNKTLHMSVEIRYLQSSGSADIVLLKSIITDLYTLMSTVIYLSLKLRIKKNIKKKRRNDGY